MAIPTRSDLRDAFAEAAEYSKYSDFNEFARAIRAAVDVVIPNHMNRGLPHIRAEFLALADAIQGKP